LSIELRVSQRKLHSFSDFLLLHIKTTNVRIRNIWLLSFLIFSALKRGATYSKELNSRIALGRENIYQRVGVPV
jgi:hypothetical protein